MESKEQERRAILLAAEIKMYMTRWTLAHNLPDPLYEKEPMSERERRRRDNLARTMGQLEGAIQGICDRIIELETHEQLHHQDSCRRLHQ